MPLAELEAVYGPLGQWQKYGPQKELTLFQSKEAGEWQIIKIDHANGSVEIEPLGNAKSPRLERRHALNCANPLTP